MTDVEISPDDVRLYCIARQLTKFCNVVQYIGLSTEWDDMLVPVLLTQGRYAPELFPSVRPSPAHTDREKRDVLTCSYGSA